MDLYVVSPVGAVSPTTSDPQRDPRRRAETMALMRAMKTLNDSGAFGPTSELTFTFDPVTHKPHPQVVDLRTHEVLLQLALEAVIRMASQLE